MGTNCVQKASTARSVPPSPPTAVKAASSAGSAPPPAVRDRRHVLTRVTLTPSALAAATSASGFPPASSTPNTPTIVCPSARSARYTSAPNALCPITTIRRLGAAMVTIRRSLSPGQGLRCTPHRGVTGGGLTKARNVLIRCRMCRPHDEPVGQKSHVYYHLVHEIE